MPSAYMAQIAAKTESEFLVLGAEGDDDIKILDFYNFDFQATGSGSEKGLNTSSYFVDPVTGPIVGIKADQTPLFSYYKEHMGVLSGAKVGNVSARSSKPNLIKAVSNHRNDEAGGEIDWVGVSCEMNKDSATTGLLPIEYCMQYRGMFGMQGQTSTDTESNARKWGAGEEARLMTLVTEHEEHDWLSVSEKLGTRRTPMDCLRRYQQALNTKMIKVKEWTIAEEDLLRAAVSIYGQKSWQSVSDKVPGRTAYQCQLKWRRTDVEEEAGITTKWTEDDERRLFLSVAAHGMPNMDALKRSPEEIDALLSSIKSSAGQGTSASASASTAVVSGSQKLTRQAKKSGEKSQYSWMDVSKIIPGISESRCRDKWIDSLDNSIINSAIWTADEDLILQHLVQRNGTGNWGAHAEWLPGRTDLQVAKHWQTLSATQNSTSAITKNVNAKKRKLVLPPAMHRKMDASLLDVDDFVRVLKK